MDAAAWKARPMGVARTDTRARARELQMVTSSPTTPLVETMQRGVTTRKHRYQYD